MEKGHRISRWEDPQSLSARLKKYDGDKIECCYHAFFRLNELQRKVYTCEHLKDYLLNQRPVKCGKHYNNYTSVFYDFEYEKEIRIVLDITPSKVTIVTFYIVMKHKDD